MEIEVLGDLSIKCTLSNEFLRSRWIDLNDLAYGTKAATSLFKEILDAAKYDYGVDFTAAQSHPVMIEAIPMGEGSLVLFISKNEDADELDTRFSRFTPKMQGNGITPQAPWDSDDIPFDPDIDEDFDFFEGLDAPKPEANLIRKTPVYGKAFSEVLEKEQESFKSSGCLVTIEFDRISDLYSLAGSNLKFKGANSLYKIKASEKYLLVLRCEADNFSEAMNYASLAQEFGSTRIVPMSGAGFLDKGYEMMIAENALDRL